MSVSSYNGTVTDGNRRTLTGEDLAQGASYLAKICAECGAAFQAWRADQRFCPRSACKRNYWRRAEVRGAQAYEALVKWRLSRGQGTGKRSISDLARIVDDWIDEDRKDGRPTPTRSTAQS